MSPTIALLEAELIGRVRAYLVTIGLDATASGANEVLRAPIREAIWAVGLTTLDPLDPADADVVTLEGFPLQRFLDYAELKTLEVLWGHWTGFDQSVDGASQSLSQLADRLERRVAFLLDRLAKPYGTLAEKLPGAAAHDVILAGTCRDPRRLRSMDPWAWPHRLRRGC